MKPISEQLKALGLDKNRKPTERKQVKDKNTAERDRLFNEISGLILRRQKLKRIRQCLKQAKIGLTKQQSGRLESFVSKARNVGDFNHVAFAKFYDSINIVAAKELFELERRKLQAKRHTLKQAKRYALKNGVRKKVKHKIPRTRKSPAIDASERLETLNSTVQIGLGLESSFKPERVLAVDITIDEPTKKAKQKDKAILYAAGWSLKNEK